MNDKKENSRQTPAVYKISALWRHNDIFENLELVKASNLHKIIHHEILPLLYKMAARPRIKKIIKDLFKKSHKKELDDFGYTQGKGRRRPQFLNIYKLKAKFMFHLGFYGSAALAAQTFNSCCEPNQALLYLEALCRYLQQEKNLAGELVLRALQADPQSERTINLFLLLQDDAFQFRRGLAALQSLGTCHCLNLAAYLLYKRGFIDEAARILLALAAEYGDQAGDIADILLWFLNRRPEALQAFDLALAHKPSKALHLRRAMAVNLVPRNERELELVRRETLENLSRLMNFVPEAEDRSSYTETYNYSAVGLSYAWPDNLWPLVFNGKKDVEIMTTRAKVFRKLYPDLTFKAPHLSNSNRKSSPPGRIRFGFFMEFVYPDIWNFWGPILSYLPRHIFEVILFTPGELPPWNKGFRSLADKCIEFPYYEPTKLIPVKRGFGPASFEKTRDIVASAELDILYNPLIGSNPLAQYMAYARLAPVQVVDGGCMTTTGLPEIDYYLLSEGHFVGQPESYFTERLAFIEHQTPPVFKNYREQALKIKKNPLSRKELGWPAKAHIYLCMQDLTKRHPEMDPLFAALLKEDSKAVLVLTNRVGGQGIWSDLLSNLRAQGVENAASRVLPAPDCNSQPPGFRPAMFDLIDTCLSLRCFGGGTIFNQLLAFGVPQIIWPSESYIGYLCGAIYRQMGLDDLLVDNARDYIARNIHLANNPKEFAKLRTLFKTKSSELYEHMHSYDMFAGFVSFFEDAVNRSRTGLPPAHWHRGRFYEHLSIDQLREFAEASKIKNVGDGFERKQVI